MFFKKPIDVGQKLDSREAVRYMWINWSLIGMRPSTKCSYWYYAYSVIMNIIFAIGLPLSMVIKLFFIEDLEELVENLYLNLTLTVCTIKQVSIYYYFPTMNRANTYLEKLDTRCNPNKEDRRYILNGVFICQLFYIYTPFYFIVVLGLAIISYRTHTLPYSAWYPHFFEDPEINFRLVYVYQCFADVFLVLQNSNNDMYPPCYLNLTISHMRALCSRIARIGNDAKMGLDENVQELINCIQDHKDILDFFESIRPVISVTIFLQFLITALVICLCAINFILFERDALQLLFAITFLIAVASESFPCCWLANALRDESNFLTTAIYNCKWYEQNQKFRKTMIIFMQRSQFTIEIMAGNLVPVTLQTFLAVVKFAFSMYTLLSGMKI